MLGERDGRLAPVGAVGGLGRGERIYAVRFMGDRGYVVTFRQVDPLYALDLSDPAHPAVRGELRIPGFSSALQPIDDTTLIGIGQGATVEGRPLGTQVSLFDVSDPAGPAPPGPAPARRRLVGGRVGPPRRPLLAGDAAAGAAARLRRRRGRRGGPDRRARHRHHAGRAGAAPGGASIRRSLVVGDALLTVSDAGILASDLRTLAPRGYAAFG